MAEHLADLGWEKRKIQTLADLKREIEKQIKGLPNDDNLHGQVLGLNYALNVINSFEAGLSETFEQVKNTERENLDKLPQKVAIDCQSGWLLGYADCWNKLRAILGDTHG